VYQQRFHQEETTAVLSFESICVQWCHPLHLCPLLENDEDKVITLPHEDGLVLNELRGFNCSLHCAGPESCRDRFTVRISLELMEE
jgi:hypothetical protein